MLFSKFTSTNIEKSNLSNQFDENIISNHQLSTIKGGTPEIIITGWDLDEYEY
ncbi:MAG: hypothetical protein R3E32_02505 [Chitinophagales bacterium]